MNSTRCVQPKDFKKSHPNTSFQQMMARTSYFFLYIARSKMPFYTANSIVNHNSSTSGDQILANAREIIPNKLYFTSIPFHPQQFQDIHFFSIDHILIYINFYSDFGPNNLAQVFRFCEILQDKFKVCDL